MAETSRVLRCWNCEQFLAAEPDKVQEGQHGPVGLFYCRCMTINRIALDEVAQSGMMEP